MYVANYLNSEGKEGENAENIRAYLEKVLFHSVKKGAEHRLAFIYKAENRKKTNKIESLLFGNIIVKLEDLAKGKYNQELKDFLKNKYWNFDKKLVEATDRADFIEYIGTSKKGKYSYSTINHTVKQGGYKHFLFNPKTSKGVVNIKPAAKAEEGNSTALTMADPKNAQFINQSIKLSITTADIVQENKPVERKVAVPKETKESGRELVKLTTKSGTFYFAYERDKNKFGLIKDAEKSYPEIANEVATVDNWKEITKPLRDENGKIGVTSNKSKIVILLNL